ncbi:restriction endonuclease subunit S [Pseudomonas sp. TE3786]
MVEWLREIPVHWDVSKLRYMFSFGKGLTITKENLLDEGVPCVNYGEVHSKYGFELDPSIHPLKCVSENYLISSSGALLLMGDLVFADTSEDIDGSGNFTQLTTDKVVFAGYHTIIARPIDRQCSRFYAYLFDSREFRTQIRNAVKGVKVFSVTQAILRGINIWLPTLDERKTIANFLDHETAKIDTLIEKQQQLIQLLKEKRQAVISHAVTKGLSSLNGGPGAKMRDSGVEWLGEVPEGWEIKKLKYLCTLQTGDKNTEDAVSEGEYPFFVRSQTVERLSSFTADCEAVLTAGDGVGVGKVFHYINGKFDFHQRVYMMNKFNFVNGKFFFHYLSNMFHKVALDGGAKSTVDSLRMPVFTNFIITVPPMQEQASIVKFVESNNDLFDDLTLKASNAIELMQERRTALISAAVTGKIDVRDWAAPQASPTHKEVAP